MAAVRDTHRISMSSEEIDELARLLEGIRDTAGSLSKNLSNILVKLALNKTKVHYGVKKADYTSTGTAPRSSVAKFAEIDVDAYLMEFGNTEEKAAVEAALMETITTGKPSNWQDHMPPLAERKYPATKLPGSEGMQL